MQNVGFNLKNTGRKEIMLKQYGKQVFSISKEVLILFYTKNNINNLEIKSRINFFFHLIVSF